MKRLMDIASAAALKTTVVVRGEQIEVGGVSSRNLTGLIARYPEIGELMAGKAVAPLRLVEIAADAAAALIASGCGYHGDKEAEDFAADLAIDDQLLLVEAIAKATFPNMAGPLIEQLKERVSVFVAELQKKAEASPSDETPPTT